jgi:hypothetical protein
MDSLRNSAYKVIRASGSHGEFDVIAYKPRSTLFIQCKRVETQVQADKLAKDFRANPPNKPCDVTFTQQLWVKVKGTLAPRMVSA